jgi:3-methyladenine DNA glycosylase/8-oxoguanine DNA glycosylase
VSGGRLDAESIGPGAESALDLVPRTVGLDDDPTLFAAGDGLLRELHLRNLGLRLGSTGRVFDALLPTILGQRVTTDEAERSYRRVVSSFGQPAPGDTGIAIPPAPSTLATLSYEDLHSCGIERGRAQLVIEAARRARRLEAIVTMEKQPAVRRLMAIRGIGPWTTGMVMGAAWGDRDALPRGDFHIPNTVSWVLAGEPRGSDDRMEELLEPYRPYRRRAMILVKLSGVPAPRYGPRSPKSTISGG